MTMFETVKVIFCNLFNSESQNFEVKPQLITVFYVLCLYNFHSEIIKYHFKIFRLGTVIIEHLF